MEGFTFVPQPAAWMLYYFIHFISFFSQAWITCIVYFLEPTTHLSLAGIQVGYNKGGQGRRGWHPVCPEGSFRKGKGQGEGGGVGSRKAGEAAGGWWLGPAGSSSSLSHPHWVLSHKRGGPLCSVAPGPQRKTTATHFLQSVLLCLPCGVLRTVFALSSLWGVKDVPGHVSKKSL